MDAGVVAVTIPIVSVVCIMVMVIYLRKFQNQERMSMIEKGVDPQIFNFHRPPVFNTASLRASLLMIGGGIGLLLGYFLDETFRMEEVAYFSMLFICGGLGLGASYLIEEKKAKEQEDQRKRG